MLTQEASELEADLRDGSPVLLRPVERGDAEALAALFCGLSSSSRDFRFFTGGADIRRSAERLADVDGHRRYGVLASRPGERRPIGHGAYVSEDGRRAEVAFAIADEAQGLGLATLMLAQLGAVAREHGIEAFYAEVMPENRHMIEVFLESGFEVNVRRLEGAIRIEFPIEPPSPVLLRFAELGRLHPRTESNP